MLTPRWYLPLASMALWGCRTKAAPSASTQPQSQQTVTLAASVPRAGGVVLRLAARGGTPRLYRLPGLTEVPGALRGKLPPVERVVGLDAEAEVLFVRTDKKDLLAFDLGSGRVDTVSTGVEQAALGPDGTLYAVDNKRHVTSVSQRVRFAWPQPLVGAPRELFGAADQRLVAVVTEDSGPRLVAAAADQPPSSHAIPGAGDVAATRWGDLAAVASDSGVTLVDPLARGEPAFVALPDHPRALAFSPSGHRIYVARRSSLGLAVIDRYERREIDGVALPGPAAALRLDLFGRWLLARPALGDSAWVVDLPIKRLVGAVATNWQLDLPAIGPDGTLLFRRDDDVVAYRPDSLRETGRVKGAAADVWVPSGWRPRAGYRATEVAQVGPAAGDSIGPEGPMYVQVSTSRNPDWSNSLAQELARAGLAARVLQPTSPEDGYRVVLGPYGSRAQAETIGRKLGRPYWIYQPGQ